MTSLYFLPANVLEDPTDSLLSTETGASEGSTIMHVGITSLKRHLRDADLGLIDADPLDERRFYWPVDGVLVEVTVSLSRTDGSADTGAKINTYAVRPKGTPSDPMFTFDIYFPGE